MTVLICFFILVNNKKVLHEFYVCSPVISQPLLQYISDSQDRWRPSWKKATKCSCTIRVLADKQILVDGPQATQYTLSAFPAGIDLGLSIPCSWSKKSVYFAISGMRRSDRKRAFNHRLLHDFVSQYVGTLCGAKVEERN